VSVAALVRYVGEVLGRGQALFGDPVETSDAAIAGTRLHGTAQLVGAGRRRFTTEAGDFVAGYDRFTARNAPALERLGRLDGRLSGALTDAAGADRRGRTQSGVAVDGAAADTMALAPWSGSPAAQKLLINRLRAHVARQQKLIAFYRARDAQLAAALRSMRYRARMGGGGTLWSPSGLIARPASGLGSPPRVLPDMSGLTRAAANRNARRIHLAARHDPRRIPAGPAGAAVAAALTRQGDPYVWGAKGPNKFDCSGLTQWAWRQAGVQLGGDTYAQIRDGVAVPPGQVRAGDLIFPSDSFDGHGPGHVQLAISPTEVIHAPQAGDVVRVAPMPSAYVARRPVPSQ
jgi:cell wall-associated NlpC family hydrolase